MKLIKNQKISNYFKSLSLFLIVTNIAFISIYFHLLVYEIQEKRKALNSTIVLFKAFYKDEYLTERSHFLKTLCASTNCSRFKDIENPNNYIRWKKNNDTNDYIIRTEEEYQENKCNIYFTIFETKITSDLQSTIVFKGQGTINAMFAYPMQNLITIIFHIFLIINSILTLLFSYYYFNTYSKSEKEELVDRMRLSGTLQEKNMKILTENIHHELNTPVAVIHGYISDYELKIGKQECEKSCNLYDKPLDFDVLYTSIGQINSVLNRMNGFKQITYSNGNKSVYDIMNYSTNSMKIYRQSNFHYNIHKLFMKYTLTKLANGDFLNILSNFLKNSLEAKATEIKIEGYFNKDTNNLHIFIIDNGEGIYDKNTGEHLSKENFKKIFEPYYSTKDIYGESLIRKITKICKIKKFFYNIFSFDDIQESIRGVGLYLNKELLNSRDADIIIKETSEEGTVFELIVPAKIKTKGK